MTFTTHAVAAAEIAANTSARDARSGTDGSERTLDDESTRHLFNLLGTQRCGHEAMNAKLRRHDSMASMHAGMAGAAGPAFEPTACAREVAEAAAARTTQRESEEAARFHDASQTSGNRRAVNQHQRSVRTVLNADADSPV